MPRRWEDDDDSYHTRCRCGCGEPVGSMATWVKGHNMRAAMDMVARAKRGSETAMEDLESLGWQNFVVGPRSFGFEAEFTGLSAHEAERALTRLQSDGILAVADGYHHSARSYWRITTDGSVTPVYGNHRRVGECTCSDDTLDYYGCECGYESDEYEADGSELVSPILRMGDKAFEDSSKVLRAIERAGGVTDESCGLHVHHTTRGRSLDDLEATLLTYAQAQSVLDGIFVDREDCRWAQSLAGTQESTQRAFSRMRRIANPRERRLRLLRWAGMQDRYMAVNVASLLNHRTIEFRQHHGTLHPEEVKHWVILTRALMDVNRNHNKRIPFEAIGQDRDFFLQYLNVPEDTHLWYSASPFIRW